MQLFQNRTTYLHSLMYLACSNTFDRTFIGGLTTNGADATLLNTSREVLKNEN